MKITRSTDPYRASPVTYAEGRLPSRTYLSRSFPMLFGTDEGKPARYIHRVFDEVPADDDADWDWTTTVAYTTPGGRKQVEVQVARSAGVVRKLRIQKVPTKGDRTRLEQILELKREDAARLIETLKAVDAIPIEGDTSVKVDDQLLRDLFADPTAVRDIYSQDPNRFRSLIENDAQAEDVIALQRRRDVVSRMQTWINDEYAFDEAANNAGGPEHAWQQMIEENPWILGVGLGGQLFTSWKGDQLEQTVVGRSIKGVGKRTDALLRTSGIVRSLAFAEIKNHRTKLLEREYRPGCWEPSRELAGSVVQVQQTVHLACSDIGDYLHDTSSDGEQLSSGTFLLKPRSFVIAGTLEQLTGSSGSPVTD